MDEKKRLKKSKTDKKISGVCGGFAEYFEIDATIIRVIWCVLTLCYGTGLLAYIVCALCMPDN